MNRLASETSPYLRQHADNPVDWFPWGADAFEDAATHDRPILLSVGYSSCHWCHVMAHESFEDVDTAAQMNADFTCIKVDREERPDVDAIYMQAVQAQTGRGGWPMTVFLTPNGEPFFGGTYFPKVARENGVSFTDVLRGVREAWDSQRGQVIATAAELTDRLQQSERLQPAGAMPHRDLGPALVEALTTAYDQRWGGFGRAPKFPQTMSYEALLRAHVLADDNNVKTSLLDMVTNSLDAMAAGGIYDHLGGGFSRYSTDDQWFVPHFEKMLYDNALFIRPFLHAWQVTGHDHYLQVVDETISYVLRDLRDPLGGFYSAEDADTEGVEGKFYAWSPQQIDAVLGDDAREFCNWFGVTEQGNFEGRNILRRPVRGDSKRPASIELSRQRLFQAREMRIRPGIDDKVLTEWNGLMLASLAEAALATSNQQWLDAAVKNGEFLFATLRRPDGRWLRSWQPGSHDAPARHLGYATDYAAVVDAFTRLGEATGQAVWIERAREVADQLIELFWDNEAGGVFTTGTDAESLISRPKDLVDTAVPSANSATVVALLRLGALTGEKKYGDHAEATIRLLAPVAVRHPTSFANLAGAVDHTARGFTAIVIPGEREDYLDVLRGRYLPDTVLAWGQPFDSPLWKEKEPGFAYVCQNYACGLPASTPTELATQLASLRS